MIGIPPPGDGSEVTLILKLHKNENGTFGTRAMSGSGKIIVRLGHSAQNFFDPL